MSTSRPTPIRATKICRMAGRRLRVGADSTESSTGTSRQPSTVQPSSVTAASIACSQADRSRSTRRKEHVADSVAPRIGQRESGDAANPAQESVRHLDEDARTVAGAPVARDGAAVREVVEELERFLDDVAGADAVDVGDKADATGIVLVSWVVQSLLFAHPLSPEHSLPWVSYKKRASSDLGEALSACYPVNLL